MNVLELLITEFASVLLSLVNPLKYLAMKLATKSSLSSVRGSQILELADLTDNKQSIRTEEY
jgi:hypothetical protein